MALKAGNKLKESTFFKVFSIINQRKGLFFLIFLIDVLFIAALYALSMISKKYFQLDADLLENMNLAMHVPLPMVLSYFLAILTVYSATKFYVLGLINGFFGKIKFEFRRYWSFVLLNILNILVCIGLFILLGFTLRFLAGIFNERFYLHVSKFTAAVFFLIIYAFVNLSHSLFVFKGSVKSTIGKSFALLKKMKEYSQIYFVSILSVMIYLLIFYIMGSIAKAIGMNPSAYQLIFNSITYTFLILLICFNRIYFYYLIKKNVL